MRIDRLRVDNFRGFEHREFSFHPQMNLLVGVNGTGKTSVLDALAVAAGGWFLGLRGYDTRHIRSHEVRLKAIPVVSNGSNGHQTQQVNWEFQYPCTIEASGVVNGSSLTWKRSLNTPGGRTTFVEARNIKDLAAKADNEVRGGGQVVLPLVSYYGTGRLWDTPRLHAPADGAKAFLVKEKSSRFEGYRNSVDPRVAMEELTGWIAQQSWASFQQGGEISVTFAAVRRAILGCIDDSRELYFDPKLGEVIFQIGNQGRQPFSNLSDGQRTLLTMVGDIAQKAATLNPALGDQVLKETPGIVLIDELDLHLHPLWQRRVIEDLRRVFPSVQFFATTHSPFLIQSLRSGEELLMLDPDEAPTAQLANKSLEDIASGIMGVPEPAVSQRYDEMRHTALSYFRTLERAALAPREKLETYLEELSKGIGPYADNPAYQAFLEMKRVAKLGE
jgi:predicted ATP-binding protein involved in virulence